MLNVKSKIKLKKRQVQLGAAGIGIAALIGVSMTSCSEFPTSGTLDTVEIRQNHQILTIKGDVYGVKSGGMEAAKAAHEDTSLLQGYQDKIWVAVSNAEPLPDVILKYPDIPGDLKSELKELRFILAELAHEKMDEIDKRIEIELKRTRDELLDLKDTISAHTAISQKYENMMSNAKESFQVAKGQLEKAIDHYNTSYESVGVILRKYALEQELPLSSSQYNPLADYAFADFTERELPSICPEVEGAITIDQRSALSKCIYFYLSDEYTPHDKALQARLYRPMLEFDKAKRAMGRPSDEGVEASGSFAKFDDAEKQWIEAQNEPEMKPRRELAKNEKTQKVYELEERVLELESIPYRADKLQTVSIEVPEYIEDKIGLYVEAVHEDLAGKIVKDASLQQVEEYAGFEGLSGTYEAVVVFAEMILSKDGAEGTMVGLAFQDFGRIAEDATEIIVPLFPSSVKPSWAIDPTSPERVQSAVLDHLIKSGGATY